VSGEGGRVGALTGIRSNGDLVRVLAASVGFNVAELATWLAILVYAYDLGGASLASVVAVAQLVPAALVAPVASAAGDVGDRRRLLLVGYLVQAAAMAATAVTLAVGSSPVVVVTAAVVANTSLTLTRPLQGALLPDLSRTPAELVAANSLSGVVVGVALVAGPLAIAVLLTWGGPALVFWVMAAVLVVGGVVVGTITPTVPSEEASGAAGIVRDSLAGFKRIAADAGSVTLLGLAGATMVVTGALDLLVVALAIDVLRIGDAGVGFLNVALGVGMVIGSAATVSLVGRRRLAAALGAGILLLGVSTIILGLVPGLLVSVLALLVVGVGTAFLDVTGQLLLQRITPPLTMARAFGVLEALGLLGLAAGAALGAGLVALLGIEWSVVVVGVILPVAGFLARGRLRAIDDRAEPDLTRLEALDGVPLFADLTLRARDAVTASLSDVAFDRGEVLMRQGERGDHLFVLVEGMVSVRADGIEVARLGPGEVVGEIAVLRDIPRTATVIAVGPVRARSLGRADFLAAVTGNPAVAARFTAETGRRLDELGGTGA
jgi:MFS family permease